MNLKITLPASCPAFGDTMAAVQEELQMHFQHAQVELRPGVGVVAVLPVLGEVPEAWATLGEYVVEQVKADVLEALVACGAITVEDGFEIDDADEIKVEVL